MSTSLASNHVYIDDLHFEHKLWISELSFRKQEIEIFENRLSELVSKNTDRDMLARLEQFQNQFIREKEVIDELSHKINEKEAGLANFAAENPIAIDHHYFTDQKGLREEMNRFREIFGVLKDDFFRYVAKWM